jgi:hypothetical protein
MMHCLSWQHILRGRGGGKGGGGRCGTGHFSWRCIDSHSSEWLAVSMWHVDAPPVSWQHASQAEVALGTSAGGWLVVAAVSGLRWERLHWERIVLSMRHVDAPPELAAHLAMESGTLHVSWSKCVAGWRMSLLGNAPVPAVSTVPYLH